MKSIKPMLMQLAESEYMCTDCGYKFFGIKAIEQCPICKVKFDWSEPFKLGIKTPKNEKAGCPGYCGLCDNWKSMREKRKNCDILKERHKEMRRLMYQAKKKRLAEKVGD